MLLKVAGFIIITLSTVGVSAETKKSDKEYDLHSSKVLVEAESAFMRGDFFGSFRLYDLVYKNTPKALDAKHIENIVVTRQVTLPYKDFLGYCKRESNSGPYKVEMRFYCAKSLIHMDKYVDAVDFIEKIPEDYHRLEYHFLKASLYLKLSKPSLCINEMKTAQKKVTDNTSLHFRDLIHVIHARCYLAEGRYSEAVNNFQTLSVNSDFYISTLEEQAWALFKTRNLISARGVLKILISHFTSRSVHNQVFGAPVYFRAKYLEAYIELISQNREKSQELFAKLKTEVQEFKKTNLKTKIPADLSAKLSKLRSYSQLLNEDYAFIGEFRKHMSAWAPASDVKALDDNLKYIMALNTEISTVRRLKSPELRSYLAQVIKTQRAQKELVLATIEKQISDSKRSIDAVEFKANMGEIENFWAVRTEGKRTLSEVLESYKREITHVEDYLGK